MMVTIYKRGEDRQLTRNFHLREFTCKCGICRNQYVDLDHVKRLQELRDLLGRSISVTSGYRCEVHNKAVGGVKNSQHRRGWATDIQVKGMSPSDVADKCEHFDGLGRYNTFTHVDSRGSRARWDNRDHPRPKIEEMSRKDYLPEGPSEEDINITLEDIEREALKL